MGQIYSDDVGQFYIGANTNPDFSLQVGLGEGYPLASVQVSSQFLAEVGPQAALRDIRVVVQNLGTIEEREILSRVDLAVDFTPSFPFTIFPIEWWVTRATKCDPHSALCVLTGWSIGSGGKLSARLYDKVAEIFAKSRKGHWFELWAAAGYSLGDHVWRLEFQLRREVLQELDAPTVGAALSRLAGLWSYCMDWLSLRIPNGDKNRSRWPVAQMWRQLDAADWNAPQTPLRRVRREALGSTDRQIEQSIGLLTSFMAQRRISDPDEGWDAFRAELGRFAKSRGTTAARYVEDRARAKACRASTINNRRELGLDRSTSDQADDRHREAKEGEE